MYINFVVKRLTRSIDLIDPTGILQFDIQVSRQFPPIKIDPRLGLVFRLDLALETGLEGIFSRGPLQ